MDLTYLTSEILLNDIKNLVQKEKNLTLRILFYLREISVRRAFCLLGHTSLFNFCKKELGYSDQESWVRINALKTLVQVKGVEEKVAEGSLTLTQLGQLGNHLGKIEKH